VVLKDGKIAFDIVPAKPGEIPPEGDTPAAESGEPALVP
jgi:hypothetical protein